MSPGVEARTAMSAEGSTMAAAAAAGAAAAGPTAPAVMVAVHGARMAVPLALVVVAVAVTVVSLTAAAAARVRTMATVLAAGVVTVAAAGPKTPMRWTALRPVGMATRLRMMCSSMRTSPRPPSMRAHRCGPERNSLARGSLGAAVVRAVGVGAMTAV